MEDNLFFLAKWFMTNVTWEPLSNKILAFLVELARGMSWRLMRQVLLLAETEQEKYFFSEHISLM